MVQGTMSGRWGLLAQGQMCALATAATGACASTLAAHGVNSPLITNWPAYLLMGLFVLKKEATKERQGTTWWLWVLLGVVDVEANFLAVWAYSRTSLTSAMLLDSFSIPCVMVLSSVFLKASFSKAHLLGAWACFLGVIVTVCSDALPRRRGGRGDGWFEGDALVGDAAAAGAATLYAVSNVAQEAWVKKASPTILLGRLGIAGFLVTGLQVAFLRPFQALPKAFESSVVVLAFVGYALALLGVYVASSHFLQNADATALNLSLLVADVYSVIFAALVDNDPPPPLYYLAFLCTVVGVLTYSFAPPSTQAKQLLKGDSPFEAVFSSSSSEQQQRGLGVLLPQESDKDDEDSQPSADSYSLDGASLLEEAPPGARKQKSTKMLAVHATAAPRDEWLPRPKNSSTLDTTTATPLLPNGTQ